MGSTSRLAELATAGVQVYSLRYFGRRFPIPLLRPLELWRAVREADIVHVMGYWYVLAAAVYLFARLAHKPVVICPAGELVKFDRDRLLKRLYHWLIGRHMIVGAASVIAITADEREQISEEFGIPRSRVSIIPNGIAPSRVPEADDLSFAAVPFVLFVGRLTAIKGPDLLIEAFAQISDAFPDVHLVFAGPDLGMRSRLETRAREIGIRHRVHFLGFISEGQRLYLYRRAKLLAVPSRSEVMTMVALEAAAVGTPVILTDRCGFDEVSEIGGGLVVPANQTALAQALTTMLSDSAALGDRGQRLRSFVLDRYPWPAIAARLFDHLAEVIECR
jgi:glycosyltransferase involved in cell wall biosynthesis